MITVLSIYRWNGSHLKNHKTFWKIRPTTTTVDAQQSIVATGRCMFAMCIVCHLIIFFELIELTSISLTTENKKNQPHFLALFFFNYQRIRARFIVISVQSFIREYIFTPCMYVYVSYIYVMWNREVRQFRRPIDQFQSNEQNRHFFIRKRQRLSSCRFASISVCVQ